MHNLSGLFAREFGCAWAQCRFAQKFKMCQNSSRLRNKQSRRKTFGIPRKHANYYLLDALPTQVSQGLFAAMVEIKAGVSHVQIKNSSWWLVTELLRQKNCKQLVPGILSDNMHFLHVKWRSLDYDDKKSGGYNFQFSHFFYLDSLICVFI